MQSEWAIYFSCARLADSSLASFVRLVGVPNVGARIDLNYWFTVLRVGSDRLQAVFLSRLAPLKTSIDPRFNCRSRLTPRKCLAGATPHSADPYCRHLDLTLARESFQVSHRSTSTLMLLRTATRLSHDRVTRTHLKRHRQRDRLKHDPLFGLWAYI